MDINPKLYHSFSAISSRGNKAIIINGTVCFSEWREKNADNSFKSEKNSEKFFSQTDDFRYDSVLIESYNPHPSKDENGEDWLVDFFDDQGKKKYYTRVDPYTGEITVHSISNYFSNH